LASGYSGASNALCNACVAAAALRVKSLVIQMGQSRTNVCVIHVHITRYILSGSLLHLFLVSKDSTDPAAYLRIMCAQFVAGQFCGSSSSQGHPVPPAVGIRHFYEQFAGVFGYTLDYCKVICHLRHVSVGLSCIFLFLSNQDSSRNLSSKDVAVNGKVF
jgi:hypothetical protein